MGFLPAGETANALRTVALACSPPLLKPPSTSPMPVDQLLLLSLNQDPEAAFHRKRARHGSSCSLPRSSHSDSRDGSPERLQADGDDVNNGSPLLLSKHQAEDHPPEVAPDELCHPDGLSGDRLLVDLNIELLELVLKQMDLLTLVHASRTCKLFDTLINRRQYVVRSIVVRHCGAEMADRWKHLSWLQRLQIEEAATPLDPHSEAVGFTLRRDVPPAAAVAAAAAVGLLPPLGRVNAVRLDTVGPKLLVSDRSTQDAALLRWRFELRGNNALEVGVVPLAMQASDKALHKCYVGADDVAPCGVFSTITVGSKLPIRMPMMRGSVVEVVARRSSIQVLVLNPANGAELHWVSGASVPKPYKGPTSTLVELSFPASSAMKLAATCWAKSELLLLL